MAKSFKKISKILGKISLDLIPVIIGILAALLINDYRQKLQEQKRQTILLNNLVDEFAERRGELDSMIKYRQIPVLDTTQAYSSNSEISLREIFRRADGIGLPGIYTISWESALNSQDIRNLDFELLNSLAKIAASQRYITSKVEYVQGFIYSPEVVLYDTSPEVKQLLDVMVNDLIGSEKTLINRYDDFIQLADSLYEGVTVDSIAVDSLATKIDTVSSE